MKEFRQTFKNAIERLIIDEIERDKLLSSTNDLIQEVIEHANRANKLKSKMLDHHNDYEPLNNYLRDDANNSPFILTGSSGSGKSSLMAFAAKKVNLIY